LSGLRTRDLPRGTSQDPGEAWLDEVDASKLSLSPPGLRPRRGLGSVRRGDRSSGLAMVELVMVQGHTGNLVSNFKHLSEEVFVK
jgi:hypothetical protein